MKNQSTSVAELKERLRAMRQRVANAKIDRRVMTAQLETLSFEITELEECEASLLRSLAGREVPRGQVARKR